MIWKYSCNGPYLVVQWLRLHIPHVGGPGSDPLSGTRSHMPQLKVHELQVTIPHLQLRLSAAK